MARQIDTNPLDNYSNRVDLYELDGELNGYDYGAKGELDSDEAAARLSRLTEVHLERGEDTYTGIEVQVLFSEKYYDKMSRELS